VHAHGKRRTDSTAQPLMMFRDGENTQGLYASDAARTVRNRQQRHPRPQSHLADIESNRRPPQPRPTPQFS
jgi:hypothetical protein